jgi:hypothetical protein
MTPLLVPADNVDNAQAGSRNRTPGPLAAHAAGIAHHSDVGSVAKAAPWQAPMSEHGWLRRFLASCRVIGLPGWVGGVAEETAAEQLQMRAAAAADNVVGVTVDAQDPLDRRAQQQRPEMQEQHLQRRPVQVEVRP